MRTSDEKERFLTILTETPFVSYAARKVGISRATIYRWVKDNPSFKKKVDSAIKDGRTQVDELAEMALIKNIKNGSMNAIRFYLQNNNQRYIAKRTHYIEPPTPEEEKPQRDPTQPCPECGHKELPKETKDRIMQAFRNHGIIK